MVTEWRATIDRRYHEAVIFELAGVVAGTDSGDVHAADSAVPLLRRLRAAGIATAVYSRTRNCAEVLRAAGIDELVGFRVEEVCSAETPDPASLTRMATGLGIRPGRCVVIE